MKAKLMSLALVAVCVSACSTNKSNNNPEAAAVADPSVVTVPFTGTPTTGFAASGKTAPMTATQAEMNNYVGPLHPVNNPTNLQITLDLADDGTHKYSGYVSISYDDVSDYTGQNHKASYQLSGNGTNSVLGYSNNIGLKDYNYNYWFTINGKKVFSAYFQDQWGAVIVTIEDYKIQADAQGPGTASGSVWYRNFQPAYPLQGPERKCWFITAGPYQCGSSISSKTTLTPDNGYRKLGTFQNLSISAAFH